MNKKIIYCILVGFFSSVLAISQQKAMSSVVAVGYNNFKEEQAKKKPIKKITRNKQKITVSADTTTLQANSVLQAQEDTTITITAARNDTVEKQELEEEKYMKIVRRLEKMDGWINNFNSASHRGIYGYIRGIYYGDGKIFLLTTLQNTTNIDYEIESIAFISNSIRTSKKQIAPDEVIYAPIWQTELSVIQRQSSVKAIFVFEKFFIAENKNVLMSIYENDGERNVTLKIIPDYFMNAKYIR